MNTPTTLPYPLMKRPGVPTVPAVYQLPAMLAYMDLRIVVVDRAARRSAEYPHEPFIMEETAADIRGPEPPELLATEAEALGGAHGDELVDGEQVRMHAAAGIFPDARGRRHLHGSAGNNPAGARGFADDDTRGLVGGFVGYEYLEVYYRRVHVVFGRAASGLGQRCWGIGLGFFFF